MKKTNAQSDDLIPTMMRLPRSLLRRIDDWRSQQDDVPNRTEAVRRSLNDYYDAENVTPRNHGDKRKKGV